jgi:hypothetical protein
MAYQMWTWAVLRFAAAALWSTAALPVAAQTCPGSCNGDNRVTAAELTRMVAIILRCDGNPAGCPAVIARLATSMATTRSPWPT